MLSNTRLSTRGRIGLMGSTALFALFAANPVLAQEAAAPTRDQLAGQPEAYASSTQLTRDTGNSVGIAEPHGGPTLVQVSPEPQTIGVDPTAPEPQITIANPNTPTTARDPNNITGISQMVVDQGGGFVGLCTATLINPRTVIFAAHCVNSNPAASYGANSGGRAIGFGFETNTRANAAGQTDELVRWLLGGTGGAGKYQTNLQQAFFNANYVAYNQLSLEPAANTFLYGDVAIAALDTPAANIPTWALLFSPLSNTGTIGAAGTGFNVGLVGYGNFGTGTSGVSSGDCRRRAAENILGALTDLETFELFLFGGAPNGLKQNLYFLDFDDPRRGQAGASVFDFNAFRDNARAGVNGGASQEGLTSNGDSGGPLILQNFTQQFVIGVLSGGYTRFFNGQPANGYGTVSFYQPLYLYWDWIAANNPYHYVSATAGNGSWTDPNHWVTTLDPSYYILGANGQPVNGIPNNPGEQKNGTSGDFGQICFQSGGVSDCYDTRTGVETVENRPIGTEAEQPTDADTASATNLPGGATVTGYRDGAFDGVTLEAQADGGATTQALPPATLANGLPGATGFVPNNQDPIRTGSALSAPRYFEVTLSAAGTTTLSGANITIDRLNITTAGAGLTIASGASLTSLINVNQFAGINTVNGTLTSVGDYSFFGGSIRGSGRINAPFLTSVTGVFTPGDVGVVGTLTIGGNLVMASGSGLIINTNGNGVSSRLAVTGSANVGGTVLLTPVPGSIIRAFDRYTILTAQGGVTGRFNTPAAISAILVPQLSYDNNNVVAVVKANPYTSVINTNSRVQVAYAQLLDANRAPGNLLPIFDILDLQNQATIQATLEALAPRTETLRTSLGIAAVDNQSRIIRERLSALQPDDLGGQVAYYGRRVQTAALRASGLSSADATMSDTTIEPEVHTTRLPETMSGFVTAGYLDGDGLPMPGTLAPFARDQFDGFYIAGGLETEVYAGGVLGFALSYTDLSGTTGAGGQTVDGQLYAGNLYAKQEWGRRAYVDAQVNVGMLQTSTERPGSLPGQTVTLTSDDSAFVFASEVGVGAMFGDKLRFGPRVAGRVSNLDFTRVREFGGATNLVINRQDVTSVEGRAGFVLDGTGRIRPHLTATYVHDFEDRPTTFGANFAGANFGSQVLFDLAGQDQDWFEVSGGLSINVGRAELSVSADTTIERDDVRNQSYRATVRIGF